jgi:DNA mismatch endonuclease (patch repair protein)
MSDQRMGTARGSTVERRNAVEPSRGALDPDARRALMRRFKSTDTAPEIALRRELRRAGLSGYRLHVRGLPGRPDIVYTRWKVAVFVDGGFWHGHPDVFQFGTKGRYWDEKIRRNQERDRRVTDELNAAGWSVLRFWDLDIADNASAVVAAVQQALGERGRPSGRRPGEDLEDLLAV